MSNAAFVLIAIGLSVVICVGLWVVNRRPKTFMSSIDDFEREMRALGRDPGGGPPGGRRRRRPFSAATRGSTSGESRERRP
jgi:hypothetical protein